jgi:spoIIIJ-associated protein
MSPAGFLAPADVPDPAGAATPPSPPIAAAVAQAVSAPLHDPSSPSSDPEPGLAAGSAAEWNPGAGPDPENGQAPGPVSTPPEGQGEPPSGRSRNAADPGSSIATDVPTDPDSPPTAGALPTGAPAATAPTVAVPAADAPSVGSSGAGSSPSGVGGSGPDAATESPTAPGESPALETAPPAFAEQEARPGRSPRRTYRDEPIDPQMIEEDTERAGDFLEGLLDAMDVDGDITTWVDSVGGHIDLEGPDLDMLVGANGETLDALQELTRLAVLRQSKRRVRLLIDINGFRAQQRDRLVSMVNAAAEQVIRSREDHEFQPMTPAERKVVHDAVAAIDGVRTESLGEDPNRRVVIRPE